MQALGGLLARRAEYHRCIAGIAVTSRDDDSEEKFDRSAREEADTCPNPIELSYESTIVEDIKELVFRARTMNGALVEVRRPQQQRMEAVEPKLNMLCFFVSCCLCCMLYIIFYCIKNKKF